MNKLFSEGVQSPTEIKASGGLQECADEIASEADAHSAARTLVAFLNYGLIRKMLKEGNKVYENILDAYADV